MYKFTIYSHYDVMINSEAYQQLKEQFDEEKQMHEKERERLRADYENGINKLRNENSTLSTQYRILKLVWIVWQALMS